MRLTSPRWRANRENVEWLNQAKKLSGDVELRDIIDRTQVIALRADFVGRILLTLSLQFGAVAARRRGRLNARNARRYGTAVDTEAVYVHASTRRPIRMAATEGA